MPWWWTKFWFKWDLLLNLRGNKFSNFFNSQAKMFKTSQQRCWRGFWAWHKCFNLLWCQITLNQSKQGCSFSLALLKVEATGGNTSQGSAWGELAGSQIQRNIVQRCATSQALSQVDKTSFPALPIFTRPHVPSTFTPIQNLSGLTAIDITWQALSKLKLSQPSVKPREHCELCMIVRLLQCEQCRHLSRPATGQATTSTDCPSLKLFACLEMPFQASSGLICKAQRQLDPAGWQLAGNCVFLLLIVCVALKLNCFTLPRWEISLNRVPVRERNSESYRIGLENWGTCKAQHLQINRSVTSKMAKWSPWSTQTRKWSSDLLALKYPAPHKLLRTTY